MAKKEKRRKRSKTQSSVPPMHVIMAHRRKSAKDGEEQEEDHGMGYLSDSPITGLKPRSQSVTAFERFSPARSPSRSPTSSPILKPRSRSSASLDRNLKGLRRLSRSFESIDFVGVSTDDELTESRDSNGANTEKSSEKPSKSERRGTLSKLFNKAKSSFDLFSTKSERSKSDAKESDLISSRTERSKSEAKDLDLFSPRSRSDSKDILPGTSESNGKDDELPWRPRPRATSEPTKRLGQIFDLVTFIDFETNESQPPHENDENNSEETNKSESEENMRSSSRSVFRSSSGSVFGSSSLEAIAVNPCETSFEEPAPDYDTDDKETDTSEDIKGNEKGEKGLNENKDHIPSNAGNQNDSNIETSDNVNYDNVNIESSNGSYGDAEYAMTDTCHTSSDVTSHVNSNNQETDEQPTTLNEPLNEPKPDYDDIIMELNNNTYNTNTGDGQNKHSEESLSNNTCKDVSGVNDEISHTDAMEDKEKWQHERKGEENNFDNDEANEICSKSSDKNLEADKKETTLEKTDIKQTPEAIEKISRNIHILEVQEENQSEYHSVETVVKEASNEPARARKMATVWNSFLLQGNPEEKKLEETVECENKCQDVESKEQETRTQEVVHKATGNEEEVMKIEETKDKKNISHDVTEDADLWDEEIKELKVISKHIMLQDVAEILEGILNGLDSHVSVQMEKPPADTRITTANQEDKNIDNLEESILEEVKDGSTRIQPSYDMSETSTDSNNISETHQHNNNHAEHDLMGSKNIPLHKKMKKHQGEPLETIHEVLTPEPSIDIEDTDDDIQEAEDTENERIDERENNEKDESSELLVVITPEPSIDIEDADCNIQDMEDAENETDAEIDKKGHDELSELLVRITPEPSFDVLDRDVDNQEVNDSENELIENTGRKEDGELPDLVYGITPQPDVDTEDIDFDVQGIENIREEIIDEMDKEEVDESSDMIYGITQDLVPGVDSYVPLTDNELEHSKVFNGNGESPHEATQPLFDLSPGPSMDLEDANAEDAVHDLHHEDITENEMENKFNKEEEDEFSNKPMEMEHSTADFDKVESNQGAQMVGNNSEVKMSKIPEVPHETPTEEDRLALDGADNECVHAEENVKSQHTALENSHSQHAQQGNNQAVDRLLEPQNTMPEVERTEADKLEYDLPVIVVDHSKDANLGITDIPDADENRRSPTGEGEALYQPETEESEKELLNIVTAKEEETGKSVVENAALEAEKENGALEDMHSEVHFRHNEEPKTFNHHEEAMPIPGENTSEDQPPFLNNNYITDLGEYTSHCEATNVPPNQVNPSSPKFSQALTDEIIESLVRMEPEINRLDAGTNVLLRKLENLEIEIQHFIENSDKNTRQLQPKEPKEENSSEVPGQERDDAESESGVDIKHSKEISRNQADKSTEKNNAIERTMLLKFNPDEADNEEFAVRDLDILKLNEDEQQNLLDFINDIEVNTENVKYLNGQVKDTPHPEIVEEGEKVIFMEPGPNDGSSLLSNKIDVAEASQLTVTEDEALVEKEDIEIVNNTESLDDDSTAKQCDNYHPAVDIHMRVNSDEPELARTSKGKEIPNRKFNQVPGHMEHLVNDENAGEKHKPEEKLVDVQPEEEHLDEQPEEKLVDEQPEQEQASGVHEETAEHNKKEKGADSNEQETEDATKEVKAESHTENEDGVRINRVSNHQGRVYSARLKIYVYHTKIVLEAVTDDSPNNPLGSTVQDSKSRAGRRVNSPGNLSPEAMALVDEQLGKANTNEENPSRRSPEQLRQDFTVSSPQFPAVLKLDQAATKQQSLPPVDTSPPLTKLNEMFNVSETQAHNLGENPTPDATNGTEQRNSTINKYVSGITAHNKETTNTEEGKGKTPLKLVIPKIIVHSSQSDEDHPYSNHDIPESITTDHTDLIDVKPELTGNTKDEQSSKCIQAAESNGDMMARPDSPRVQGMTRSRILSILSDLDTTCLEDDQMSTKSANEVEDDRISIRSINELEDDKMTNDDIKEDKTSGNDNSGDHNENGNIIADMPDNDTIHDLKVTNRDILHKCEKINQTTVTEPATVDIETKEKHRNLSATEKDDSKRVKKTHDKTMVHDMALQDEQQKQDSSEHSDALRNSTIDKIESAINEKEVEKQDSDELNNSESDSDSSIPHPDHADAQEACKSVKIRSLISLFESVAERSARNVARSWDSRIPRTQSNPRSMVLSQSNSNLNQWSLHTSRKNVTLNSTGSQWKSMPHLASRERSATLPPDITLNNEAHNKNGILKVEGSQCKSVTTGNAQDSEVHQRTTTYIQCSNSTRVSDELLDNADQKEVEISGQSGEKPVCSAESSDNDTSPPRGNKHRELKSLEKGKWVSNRLLIFKEIESHKAAPSTTGASLSPLIRSRHLRDKSGQFRQATVVGRAKSMTNLFESKGDEMTGMSLYASNGDLCEQFPSQMTSENKMTSRSCDQPLIGSQLDSDHGYTAWPIRGAYSPLRKSKSEVFFTDSLESDSSPPSSGEKSFDVFASHQRAWERWQHSTTSDSSDGYLAEGEDSDASVYTTCHGSISRAVEVGGYHFSS